MAAGGHGCISVVVERRAQALRKHLMTCALEGDYAGALKIQDRLVPLHHAIFMEPGLAGAKCTACRASARIEEEVRLPLIPVTPATGASSAMRHGSRRPAECLSEVSATLRAPIAGVR
jgi:4-hydroxy-tetrahydrodipicolinate synthase